MTSTTGVMTNRSWSVQRTRTARTSVSELFVSLYNKKDLLTDISATIDLAFFNSDDCSGDPMVIMPPASILRERPVAGCSNYAAAGITSMSYKVEGV